MNIISVNRHVGQVKRRLFYVFIKSLVNDRNQNAQHRRTKGTRITIADVCLMVIEVLPGNLLFGLARRFGISAWRATLNTHTHTLRGRPREEKHRVNADDYFYHDRHMHFFSASLVHEHGARARRCRASHPNHE